MAARSDTQREPFKDTERIYGSRGADNAAPSHCSVGWNISFQTPKSSQKEIKYGWIFQDWQRISAQMIHWSLASISNQSSARIYMQALSNFSWDLFCDVNAKTTTIHSSGIHRNIFDGQFRSSCYISWRSSLSVTRWPVQPLVLKPPAHQPANTGLLWCPHTHTHPEEKTRHFLFLVGWEISEEGAEGCRLRAVNQTLLPTLGAGLIDSSAASVQQVDELQAFLGAEDYTHESVGESAIHFELLIRGKWKWCEKGKKTTEAWWKENSYNLEEQKQSSWMLEQKIISYLRRLVFNF